MNMKHLFTCSLALLMLSMTAAAQENQTKQKRKLPKLIQWVKDYMDYSTVKGIDSAYIDVPEKEWTAELTTTVNHASLKLETDWNFAGLEGLLTAKTSNNAATSLGAAIAYRSYGIGYSKILNGEGSIFSLSFSGSNYAINGSITNYSSDTPTVSFKGKFEGETMDESTSAKIDEPINVRTMFIDGYYIFNSKKFSYLAAYTPSLIQRRSAGSLIAGAMYFHARTNYESSNNTEMLFVMQGVGKIKVDQASIGMGYAYNWVPARGLVINIMAMPMLTLYNRTKLYRYEFEYIGDVPIEEQESLDIDDYKVVGDGDVTKTPNKVRVNFDGRIAAVYNWQNWFVRTYGQFNTFKFGHENTSGRFSNWSIYASIGRRF